MLALTVNLEKWNLLLLENMSISFWIAAVLRDERQQKLMSSAMFIENLYYELPLYYNMLKIQQNEFHLILRKWVYAEYAIKRYTQTCDYSSTGFRGSCKVLLRISHTNPWENFKSHF